LGVARLGVITSSGQLDLFYRFPYPTAKGTYIFGGREYCPILAYDDAAGRADGWADLAEGIIKFLPFSPLQRFLRWITKEETAKLPPDKLRQELMCWEAQLNCLVLSHYQLVDDTNPLAEVAQRRKIALPKGEHRRWIHPTHYARLCPIETPESNEIGLRLFLARAARLERGQILAPYTKPGSRRWSYLRPQQEENCWIAFWGQTEKKPWARRFIRDTQGQQNIARMEIQKVPKAQICYVEAVPYSFLSLSSCLVPFIQHTDGARAMMGGKNLKQALPLVERELPIVKTGSERTIAQESGWLIEAPGAGEITQVSEEKIILRQGRKKHIFLLSAPRPGNQGGYLFQQPRVQANQKVRKGEPLVDAAGIKEGELVLGCNVLVAYMPFFGYNFEDGIVISERLARRMSSRHIYEETLKLKEGERFTAEASSTEQHHLTSEGIIQKGTVVQRGELLIRKRDVNGRPHDCQWQKPFRGKVLRSWIVDQQWARVWIEAERPLEVGDKLMGRHGNKGVVTKILSEQEMPYFIQDGQRCYIEAVLNPLSVLSRMNLGQLLETHYSWLPERCTEAVGEPFRHVDLDQLAQDLQKAGVAEGKKELHLMWKGKLISLGSVVVGRQYLVKLNQLAADKFHVRLGGQEERYSPVTQQPSRGKRLGGGQRLGEMEVWALEAHEAYELLREMLTAKSDDILERNVLALARCKTPDGLPDAVSPKFPETLRALKYYFRGLGLELKMDFAGGKEDVTCLKSVSMHFASTSEIKGWAKGARKIIKSPNDLRDESIFGKDASKQRERMGYIPLAIPVLHPLLAAPKMLQQALGDQRWQELLQNPCIEAVKKAISKQNKGIGDRPSQQKALREILQYQWFAVLERKNNKLVPSGEVISFVEYQAKAKQGQPPQAKPILELLLEQLSPKEKQKCLLEVVPVIPLGYRPEPEGTLNHLDQLYQGVVESNRPLLQTKGRGKTKEDSYSWTENKQRRRLYRAVSALFIYGENRGSIYSLLRHLQGQDITGEKEGVLTWLLLGKRQDFSGRAVIVPNPQLQLDECALPLEMLLAWLKQETIQQICQSQKSMSEAQGLVDKVLYGWPTREEQEQAKQALEAVLAQRKPLVLLNRQPTLHKYNVLAFRPRVRMDFVIAIPPLVCAGYNADFDGDTMAVYLPLTRKAQQEAEKLLPSQHLFKAANGELILNLSQDIVLGAYLLAQDSQGLQDLRQTLQLGEDEQLPTPLPKGQLKKLITRIAERDWGKPELLENLREFQRRAFERATLEASRSSFSMFDLRELALNPQDKNRLCKALKGMGDLEKTLEDRHREIEDVVWAKVEQQPDNPVAVIALSGARGDKPQLRQLVGMIGWAVQESGKPFDLLIHSNFLEGLRPWEYWALAHSTRRTMLDKKLGVADAGGLTRHLVEGAYECFITQEDCGTSQGILLKRAWFQGKGVSASKPAEMFARALYGRVLAQGMDGAEAGNVISDEKVLNNLGKMEEIRVRSPLTCLAREGICQKCYGYDLSRRDFPPIGYPAGILAGQSVGERGTQLSMQTFHTGTAALPIRSIRQLFMKGEIKLNERSDLLKNLAKTQNLPDLLDGLMSQVLATYKDGVSPIHFEVLLSIMKRHGWQGLSAVARDWRRRGFLAAASYGHVQQVLAEAALSKASDQIRSLKAQIIIGVPKRPQGGGEARGSSARGDTSPQEGEKQREGEGLRSSSLSEHRP
jgi:DNA-directed RNA polymerase beta' subunit